jgi:HK97 family phage portal protein
MRLKFNFRDGLHFEKHNIDKIALWGRGEDIGDPVHAGVLVSQTSALGLSVVYRCVSLISGTLGALPADIVRKRTDIREPVDRTPAWVDVPNPESTWFEFARRVFESLAMDGNAFVLITARDFAGQARELWTLNPRAVQIRRRETSRRMYFLVNGSTEYTRFGPDNLLGDVLHVKLNDAGGMRGLSPLDLARQGLGLGLVSEKFGAKFFGSGQQMSGVIQLPVSDRPKTKENIDLIRENWEAKHAGSDKAHRPGVLTGGATWQSISVTPENAQFLETRKFQVEDIARWYGVPAHMVGLEEKNTSWGTGIEAQSLGFVRFTLLPWIELFEQAMSQLLVRGQELKLNQRGLLRADSKTEAEVLVLLSNNGIVNRNEVRALYDKPPVPGGDRFILPLNMQILQSNGQAEPAPVTPPPASEPSPNGNGNGQASLPLEVKE